MGVKIAGNCLRSLPHCFSSSQTLPSIISSISAKRSGGINSSDRPLITCQIFHQIGNRSPFLGTSSSTKLSRRRSLEDLKRIGGRSKAQFLRRAFSESSDSFADDDDDDEADDEFVRRLQESAQEDDDDNNIENLLDCRNQETEINSSASVSSLSAVRHEITSPSAEPPWLNGDEILPAASLEMKANCLDMPLSLRIIKRKKRWEEGFKDASESAYCSIKKAFSSMVFIVRELQSYTLQMREILFYENLQGILARVQGEMNASFVWLFQQIFSCTPTLMVYVMLLLANFTVYSIGQNSAAFAAVSSNPSVIAVEQEDQQTQKQNSRFDASSIKSSFSVGRTALVDGSGGGGGKVKPVVGATDDGRSDGSCSSYIAADGISTAGVEGSETLMEEEEEETILWDRIVEEASRMQASSRDETLMDSDTLQQLVSPVTVELEPEKYVEYSAREFMYHQALSQDPDNVLLLSNFAQFLFVVLHDHDRAEYYFKRAVGMKPGDAEALHRYAMFLWLARKDLEAAEEAYLEGIAAADPGNTYYAASYAHFLWNTGGEDTCYPLDGSDAC